MSTQLAEFESVFQRQLDSGNANTRDKAGCLLPLVPSRHDWDRFTAATRQAWEVWRTKPDTFPACLVVLYGGLAFFEYEDATFWPRFAEATGCPDDTVPLAARNRLNNAYCQAVRRWGMKLIGNDDRMSYVGSAVHHIGIPISLWDGFLDLCEWAAARHDWQTLSDSEWESTVTRLSGSRRRLRSFLISNRQVGADIIREMLDARHCLASDPTLTIDQLKQACLLRVEYFDEVPETADFLKPNDPESLFDDRPRLLWKEQSSSLTLHVPGLDRNRLPATWQIGARTFAASATPDEATIDSAAFTRTIQVALNAQSESQAVQLQGIQPWGLFDMERGGYWVNASREELPLRSYVLIASKPVQLIRQGFEEADCPANDRYELPDGTLCFVTRLWPRERFASLTIAGDDKATELKFRTRKRIETRLFVGQGWHSARFRRNGDTLNVEKLPLVCALVPIGYFANSEKRLMPG